MACGGGSWFKPSTTGLSVVVAKAEASAHEQWGKTKAQESKPKLGTKDNQKIFSQQWISQKSIPFISAGPSPFIGRRADFLHSENTLV
jgi:hypothetical protein